MDLSKHSRLKWVLIVSFTIITILVSIYLIVNGRRYFTRRGIFSIQKELNSFGGFSPFMLFFLILLSTIVPPLPLPIPLIEMAAGLIFGFWYGFILVWISQIVSSLMAFLGTRYIGSRVMKGILKFRFFHFYQNYLEEKGPIAIFAIRFFMAAPFNIISFLAGLTHMETTNFILATAFGTIPEAILYSYVGFLLQSTRLRLWYIFILVVLSGAIGPLITYIMLKYFQPRMLRKHKRK